MGIRLAGPTRELRADPERLPGVSATAFSLLGLRQVYFLIDGLLDRLVYLTYGLAAVVAFIG